MIAGEAAGDFAPLAFPRPSSSAAIAPSSLSTLITQHTCLQV
jgi:hypothetical protein